MTAGRAVEVDASDAEDGVEVLAGITIGVTGLRPRWTVSPWGSVIPWGTNAGPTLDWHVAADDRWHVPAAEPTVRQTRIEGTPVVETRVRVPDGDAVQRVWAVPEQGGMVVVEFENESPKPFAIALSGAEIVTERPTGNVPIEGIELPDDTVVMPVGHRAIVRVAVRHADGEQRPVELSNLPPALNVARGWTRVVEQASRLVLPDEPLVDAVVAARCDLLLEGPVDVDADPAGFLLDVAELVRCGDSAEAWMLDIVEPAERVAAAASGGSSSGIGGLLRRRSRADGLTVAPPEARHALEAAQLVAQRAGDRRAAGDLHRLIERIEHDTSSDESGGSEPARLASFADLRRGASVGRFVGLVERRLADGGNLLPGGMPTTWLGNNFEVHAIPTAGGSTVSYAVRWHGERPAVLWEQHGEQIVELTASDLDAAWATSERSGETLWPAPKQARTRSASLTLNVEPDGASFN